MKDRGFETHALPKGADVSASRMTVNCLNIDKAGIDPSALHIHFTMPDRRWWIQRVSTMDCKLNQAEHHC
jgi:hypothetical protein